MYLEHFGLNELDPAYAFAYNNRGNIFKRRGDYNNAQFDWESYWNDNTYDNAVVFGSNLLTDLGEYSYTSGSYTFNHVRRIGATIQQEVDHATAGDTVLVNEGTYVEQVTVNKDLTLLGEDGKAVTFIQAPATLPNTSTTDSIIVKITGAGVQVEMSEFTVTGPGPGGCGTIAYGIFVGDGAYANIHDNRVVDIRDTGLSGCQNGNAIGVGRQFWSTTGTADITDNEIATYQKTGIIVDNTGSSANITGNTISGEGAISYIAENCELAPDLNMTDAHDIRIVAEAAHAELADLDPDTLRQCPDVRATAADRAARLASILG